MSGQVHLAEAALADELADRVVADIGEVGRGEFGEEGLVRVRELRIEAAVSIKASVKMVRHPPLFSGHLARLATKSGAWMCTQCEWIVRCSPSRARAQRGGVVTVAHALSGGMIVVAMCCDEAKRHIRERSLREQDIRYI